jgi:hypothetical protein
MYNELEFESQRAYRNNLTEEVEQHKQRGEEPTTAPAILNELSLIILLCQHSETVFNESRDHKEASNVRYVVLGVVEKLKTN